MWIDAYDALGVSLDCTTEDIKKAGKKQLLLYHPDKACQTGGNAEEMTQRTIELQEAKEILEDEERRKRYNTFGIDLGKDQPENEVFEIGRTHLVMPLGGFLLKTVVCRLALWLLTFTWLAYLLLFCGLVGVILFISNINITLDEKPVSIRSLDGGLTYLLPLWIVDGVCLLQWIGSDLILDTLSMVYLASEICGYYFLESLKVGVLTLVVCIFIAWLVRGWWLYIIGFEVGLAIFLLIAVVIASCIIRLWIEQVQATREQKVKEWRLNMRKERDRLVKEVENLKKKLENPRRTA